MTGAKNRWFLTGLFLICMTTLMLQIIETRILSVVSMYYLAFVSISMAMLGMTGGALIVYFRLGSVTKETAAAYLARLSTAYALGIAICFVLQSASPPFSLHAVTALVSWVKVLYLLAAPFTIAGIAVSLALTKGPTPVGITYGVDLCGAAFGCLAVLGLLEVVDGASAMFVVAAIAALAGYCFNRAVIETPEKMTWLEWPVLRQPAMVAGVLLAAGIANSSVRAGLQPASVKFGTVEIGSSFDFEKWNSFSRIAVTHPIPSLPGLWGASPTLPSGQVVEQRLLNIDGQAGTYMPRFDGRPETVSFLKYDVTNLAYAARPDGRVAVIGVGSGRDLLSAHLFGARDITGVEINPTFIRLLTDPTQLRGYAGVADLPGVRFVVDEGRSWFARTTEKFDLIQMSMIDTFAATGAGAFSLSENGLYTVEGWKTFMSRLDTNGMFTVSRWYSPKAPIEVGRTISLAVAALQEMGIERAREHIYIAATENLATLVVGRQPLSAADIAKLDEASQRLQFKVLVAPGRAPTEAVFLDILSAKNRADLDQRTSAYWLDLSPATDARPFFFNQLRIFDVRNMLAMLSDLRRDGVTDIGHGLAASGNLSAFLTLFMLILLSTYAVVRVILAPARSAINDVAPALAKNGSIYFLLIGLGFMFVEIGLIQRISVFMGHPVYALSVVLFSIILSTGIGSLLSDRFAPRGRKGIMIWLAALSAYVLSVPYWLPELLASPVEQAGIVVRSLVSIAVVLPAGLLMGFGFPVGMRLVSAWDSRPTPWFWGINGAAGVLASGLAVACSIGASIDTTLTIGALCYLALVPSALTLLEGAEKRARVRAGGLQPLPAT